MNQKQINELAANGIFPEGESGPELVETHASWVLLTAKYAYKIKKPIRFSFLDFSTLENRKTFCEKEVELNSRLTDIYLSAEPVVKTEGRIAIGEAGEVIDYAVKMKRLPPKRQMHLLLKKNEVRPEEIEALAVMIAEFHQRVSEVKKPFNAASAFEDFADVLSVAPLLGKTLAPELEDKIALWIKLAKEVLLRLSRRFQERVEEGFVRDGHGDLHSGNIFLLDKPVIFDCIEFSEHFRVNDVLSELSFLAMDLERYGRADFKEILVKKYQEVFPCFIKEEDHDIFRYYLLYRASVRLKINALHFKENREEGEDWAEEARQIRSLAELCDRYAAQLGRVSLHAPSTE